MTTDFFDLSYLGKGSIIQRKGLEAIQKTYVMEPLKDFTPVLAGTLPLNLFTDESDLDILCFCNDLKQIESRWLIEFGHHKSFNINNIEINSIPSSTANFSANDFKFELFAQAIPTRRQTAYLHMINEHAILQKEGEVFKQKVIELKKQGMKTEAAFAILLGLSGDPFEAILRYPV